MQDLDIEAALRLIVALRQSLMWVRDGLEHMSGEDKLQANYLIAQIDKDIEANTARLRHFYHLVED